MKKVLFVLLIFLGVSGGIFYNTFSSYNKAKALQNMEWTQVGKKYVLGSYIRTGFSGTVSLKSKNFVSDKAYWTGNSSTVWLGLSPFYADSMSHTDKIWLSGIGSVSISSSSIGVSTSTEKGAFTYSINEKTYSVGVNYSYSGKIWKCFYVGQKSYGQMRIGSRFYVVDSETDQTYEYKSSYYYT